MNRACWRRVFERTAEEGWALVALRFVVGIGFVAHGFAKLTRGPEHFAAIVSAMGLPAPLWLAWLTVLLELLGGISILLGAGVAFLSVPLIVVMFVAMIRIHLPYGFSSVRLMGLDAEGARFGPVGYELNLLYIGALLALALGPKTPLSIDRWLEAKRKRTA